MNGLLKYVLLALLGFASGALAQYPSKTVRILVGYPPGGTPDIVARTMGSALSQSMGQQFVPENKPGAGGILAADLVAKSPPDGYTLLSSDNGQMEINPHLFRDLPYSPASDFTPITLVGVSPLILVSSAKSQIKTLGELVREAKANPGKIVYGSAGIGSIHHIVFEAFSAAAGVNMAHVPFKGNAPTYAALLAGEIHVALTSLSGNINVRGGTVNMLGVSLGERYKYAPDVPSIAEQFKGFEFLSEHGIAAPAGLPPDVLSKLSSALRSAIEAPEMQERYGKLGLILTWTTPDAYRERIRRGSKKFEEVIKGANIQPR